MYMLFGYNAGELASSVFGSMVSIVSVFQWRKIVLWMSRLLIIIKMSSAND